MEDKENPQDLNSLKRTRSTHLAQMTKIYKELEKNMMSRDNVEYVEQLYSKLCERFEQFATVNQQCLDVCMQADISETLQLNFESSHKNFVEFRERFSQWIADTHKEGEPDDNDRNSVVSKISSTSYMSSRSKLCSATAKRLVAEHRLKNMKTKLELERKRRELELEQQLIDQQSQLEEAKLEESVWRTAVSEENIEDKQNSQSKVSEENIDQDTQKAQFKHNSGTFHASEIIQPVTERKSSTDNSVCVEQLIKNNNSIPGYVAQLHSNSSVNNATLQEGFNLPKPELLTFDGSPANYMKFIRNFETNIDSKISDNQLKLSYLIQYCKGEARDSIEDCVLFDSNEGYSRARTILQSRYGRPHIIARSYVDSLVYGAPVKASDISGLSKLSLDMQKCDITLSQLGFTSDIDNSENLRRMVKRLPMHLRTKWVDVAHSINESGREPRFCDLCKFVDEKSRIASSMYGFDICTENHRNKDGATTTAGYRHGTNSDKVRVTTLATQSEGKVLKDKQVCKSCTGTCKDLSCCEKFKSMNLDDRYKLLRKLKLCYNCLKGNHFASKCRISQACSISDCNKKHHFLLHSWVKPEFDHTVIQPSVNCAATNHTSVKNCLGIIPVTVTGGNGNSCQTYALLDDGADKSLCDERLLQKLDVASKPVSFQISTVNSSGGTIQGHEVDLNIKTINCSNNQSVKLDRVWSVKQLPISTRSAAVNADIRDMPHLSDLEIPEIDVKDVMLLIGTDSPGAHIPLDVRSGDSCQPYAIRTLLGWVIRGPIRSSLECKNQGAHINFSESKDVLLQQQLERMWTTDFSDSFREDKSGMSVEDKKSLKIMEETITHEDGHYKLGLPWRDGDCILPNNITLAHARLEQLKRKLSRDETLHIMYTKVVNEYIEKGYAKEITNIVSSSKRIWYLPHHPVTNVNKPGKVRVVFDCAAKYKGISLNSQLMQGPDLMNSLVGVVIRFRQERIALAADIEAMFHQVRVVDDDCDALRFLWWPNGDLTKEPKHFCMQVHLFGGTSSPSCTLFALKRTATDHAHLYDQEVITTVDKNFYVDDCLTSVPTEQHAIKLATDLQSLMKLGGFRLTKWISNSRQVIEAIPQTELAPSIVSLNPDDALPNDKALGIIWDVNSDRIKFRVKVSEKPLTRRGILSTVSSIFDPLGLVSPVTLKAKSIIQSLCKAKLGWDDPIPQNQMEQWRNWLQRLPCLENVSVNRCLKPDYLKEVVRAELHIFSDGSEMGYGACAYLRLVDVDDNVTCSLVMGKARLAPIKQMSIPKLELSGVVTACRLYELITDELEVQISSVTFWTDSTIVLGYIRNTTRRFKTFVANRLSTIHTLSCQDQWRYIETKLNPADIASRGLDPSDSPKMNMWLYGPSFLRQEPSNWPKDLPSNYTCIPDNDIELKKEIVVNATTIGAVDDLISYFSDWMKLRRAVAWFLRYKCFCRRKYLNHDLEPKRGDLTHSELERATKEILTNIQIKHFSEEIEALKKGNFVKKSSRLAGLSPFIDHNLIRTKGRVNQRKISDYQVILPGSSHVTTLIIRFYHEVNGHVGRQQVLAETRKKYWILTGPSAVKKIINRCVPCKRRSGPLCSQQMAPLLKEQTTPDKPPFTYVGIDYFGPLIVRSGRCNLKRYGCLFTCLTSRAVHLEIAHSLTTDSFIAAFQRFVSRRGVPEKIYSDNGTNLVSGDSSLRKSIEQWNQSKIGKVMIQKEIDWHFNPPTSKHMGGAWERLIRSTREILRALAKEQLLTDEQLLTLMTEVEKILNDRPITPVSNDPNDPIALSPNMLLLMKSNYCLPQGLFKKEDLYAHRWWRQVQYLANIFWKRWIREYLPALQNRQKWQRPKRDLQVGDVVLVAQENVPRGQWPLGRVTKVNVGRDGFTRSCVIKTRTTVLVRPISNLCFLECY